MTDQRNQQDIPRHGPAPGANRAPKKQERDIEERRQRSDSAADRERTAGEGQGGSSGEAS
jgi:hypothetical protein